MKRGRGAYWVWVVSVVLLAGWFTWFFGAGVTVVEQSKAARLEARQAPHDVDALTAGLVVATHLSLGARVRAGDVLIELDASDLKLQRDNASARMATAAARIEVLKRQIAAREAARVNDRLAADASAEAAEKRSMEAAAAAEFAESTDARVTKLSASGGASKVEALKAATEAKKLGAVRDALAADARGIVLAAEARSGETLAAIEELRDVLATLDGDKREAAAEVTRLDHDIDRRLIRAPVSGRLGDVVPLQSGTYVEAGLRVATVIPDGDLIITASFDPALALGRVRPGQRAELRLDGFPWAQYGVIEATLTKISSEARDNLIHAEFRIDKVPDSGILMDHGLPGLVEVAVETVAPATLVMRSVGLVFGTGSAP